MIAIFFSFPIFGKNANVNVGMVGSNKRDDEPLVTTDPEDSTLEEQARLTEPDGLSDSLFTKDYNVSSYNRRLQDKTWFIIKFESDTSVCMRGAGKWDGDTRLEPSDTHTGGCNGYSGNSWWCDAENERLENLRGGCLDYDADKKHDNPDVRTWACHHGKNQKWFLDGANRFRTRHEEYPNHCLARQSDGNVRLADCNGDNNRKFVVPGEAFECQWCPIRFESDGTKCMRRNDADGRVTLGDCNGYSGNKWMYDPATSMIHNARGGCLMSKGPSSSVYISSSCSYAPDDKKHWWMDYSRQLHNDHPDLRFYSITSKNGEFFMELSIKDARNKKAIIRSGFNIARSPA